MLTPFIDLCHHRSRYSLRPITDPEIKQPSRKDPKTQIPLEGIDINSVSEENLIGLLKRAPVLYTRSFGGATIVQLTRSLVLKGGPGVLPAEAEI